MDTKYDEDISDNPLFKELQTEHSELLYRIIEEGWIICVPRCGALQRSTITTEDILAHILVPSDELPETHFRSLNNCDIRMHNRVLTLETSDSESSFSTHIIFEETFYTEEFSKYKVWCIEAPLITSDQRIDNNTYSINTLRDCIDLLWSETLGKQVLENLDSTIQLFLNENKELENCSLQTLIDLVSLLYKDCLKTTLRERRLNEKASRNKLFLDNIKLAVETYMHHGIYKKLFEAISARTANEDSKLNKLIRNLSDLQLKDLDVRPDLYDTIPCAKQELAKMTGYSTILGKVGCLRKTISTVTKQRDLAISDQGSAFLSADELLPVMVFLIIKTALPNWIAHLTFLSKFRFSSSLSDESSFLITTLEASIEHISSEVLFGPYAPESQLDDDSYEMINMSSVVGDSKIENKLSVAYLFEQVRIGNYDEVQSILNRSKQNNQSNEFPLQLCHPLCSCDKCDSLLSQPSCDRTPTVQSYDDRGFTALHVACFHGRPKIVDLLIMHNADVNATDYSGATPLHYAALRGHQNALLLILHAGADINARDNLKNTPLHFASSNGHEGCVKAMLYFSEHCPTNLIINCVNHLGDTPLHHASRWGYVGIVNTLLEYGARANIENKRKLTPLDCAHSVHITKIIYERKAKQSCVPLISKNMRQPSLDFQDENRSTLESTDMGVRPQSTEQIKRVESLLRAVAFGDINLVCYYLNLSLHGNDIKLENSCHPLCTCSKCLNASGVTPSTSKRTDILNVNVCNSDGVTSLHVAAMHGWVDLTKLLLDNGAKPNLITKSKGLTALHLSCQHRRPLVARKLVEVESCAVNLQDYRGNTALHYVCHVGDMKLAEILINAGANPNIKNSNGITPINEADERIYISLANYLRNQKQTL